MDRNFRAAAPPPSGRTVTKEADEELALFLEMRKQEKERNNLLLPNGAELDPPLGSKPGTAPIFKIASSPMPPARKAGMDDILNSDNEKNDYDWLITPPGTPLFPSLDTESKKSSVNSAGSTKARPAGLKSRLANASDPPRNASLKQQTSSSGLNSTAVGSRRPSSSGGPTHSATRPVTPNGRPLSTTSSKPTRSSTPTSRATVPLKSSAHPARSSTPVRSSSTPASRPSVPAASKPANSRSATPTRRTCAPSVVPANSAPSSRSSSVTRQGPTISKSSAATVSKNSAQSISKSTATAASKSTAPTVSKSSALSHGNSPTITPRSLKPSEVPGLPLDAPASLKTSVPERSSSASRGRSGAPISRSSSVEPGPNARPRRQSCSPSRGRVPNGVHKGSSVPPPSRSHASGGDNMNPILIGNKMVERIVNMRRLMPPKQDDQRSNQNNLSGKSSLHPDSTGFGRTLSKKSLDMALRHMDIRQSTPSSLRPLMANIPASSVYSVRSGSTRSRGVSISGSPLTTSSTASSEYSVNNNMISLDAIEIEDDLTRERGDRFSPAVPLGR